LSSVRRAFLVCATPRSGSGLLCGALAATGAAGNPDEWFPRSSIHRFLGEWGIRDASSTASHPVPKAGIDYLKYVRQAAICGDVLGLKVHWYQLEWCQANGIFEDILDVFPYDVRSQLRVIFLRRHDVIGQAISTLIAEATNIYFVNPGIPPRVTKGLEHCARTAPRYDFLRLREIVATIEAHQQNWLHWFTKQRLSHFDVSYEQLVDDYGSTVRSVLDYLGVDPEVAVPPPQAVKQATITNNEFRRKYLRDCSLLGRSTGV